MDLSEDAYRHRVNEHKMAITKLIYKRINVDRAGDDVMIIAALAELTATYGARVIGRAEAAEMLRDLSRHVSETELIWPAAPDGPDSDLEGAK
jgi:hypothetical protein